MKETVLSRLNPMDPLPQDFNSFVHVQIFSMQLWTQKLTTLCFSLTYNCITSGARHITQRSNTHMSICIFTMQVFDSFITHTWEKLQKVNRTISLQRWSSWSIIIKPFIYISPAIACYVSLLCQFAKCNKSLQVCKVSNKKVPEFKVC
jgi:hypothetical protein